MKSVVIIKSNNLSKGNHILLSKDEIKSIKLEMVSYDSMNKEPLTELYNEYYKEERRDSVRYNTEPELIICGKIFNYSNLEKEEKKEEKELSQKLKSYIETKFNGNLDLKDKEKLLKENILKLNKENVHEIGNWEYTREFDIENDYRDVVIEITPVLDESIIVYLDDMYIYKYIENINIKDGFGEYELILRKNPIIKDNLEIM